MEFTTGKLKGVFFIEPNPIEDERGFFMRTYDVDLFNAMGLHLTWRQENHSKSIMKHTIRGLHFQLPPHAETKLVRCVRGEILDVFVDLRKDSETFGQYDSVVLSESNKIQVLIPAGFAHGFCSLTDSSEVLYKVDNFYCKEAERGLLWNDTSLGISWPTETPVISVKDSLNWTFEQFVRECNHIDLNSINKSNS